jgi:hypothetical protein
MSQSAQGTFTFDNSTSAIGGLTDANYKIFVSNSGTGGTLSNVNSGAGKLVVNNIDILEKIQRIEERLAIIEFDERLEDQWLQLKEIGIKYRELHNEILEKEKMYSILRGDIDK